MALKKEEIDIIAEQMNRELVKDLILANKVAFISAAIVIVILITKSYQ